MDEDTPTEHMCTDRQMGKDHRTDSNQIDNDPFFSMHQQQMQRMNQMMSMDPFAGFMGQPGQQRPQIQDGRSQRHGGQIARQQQQPGMGMFGGNDIFSHMNQMMGNMNQMMASMQSQMMDAQQSGAMSGAPVYSHQSVMTYSNDGRGGQPKVYQASTTTTNAGNGVRETKKTVRDSEQGIAKMAIDRQIGDRRHCVTQQKNMRSGDIEENNEFDNLDEEEASAFHEEFQQRSYRPHPHQQRGLTAQRHSPHHRPTHHQRGLPRPRDRDHH